MNNNIKNNINKYRKFVKQNALGKYLSVILIMVFAFWLINFFTTKEFVSAEDFVDAGPFKIAILIEPETPQVGKNHIQILVRNQQGESVSGAKVRAVGEMPAMGSMPAMYAQADTSETSAGTYEGDFELSMAGSWPLSVDVGGDEDNHVRLIFDMATTRKGIQLTTVTPAGDVAYHTCSMHPSVKSAVPRTCPICGMDLVPVTHEELRSGSIMVDEGLRQTIGVKTGQVIRAPFSVPINLQGEITYDESRLRDISLRFGGWIGELNADHEGKSIAKGDILFTVYSPELLSLQEEYLQSFKRFHAIEERGSFNQASRKRLLLWGLDNTQINWLEKQGKAQDYVPIFSPSDGVVIEKHIISGSAFTSGQRLLRLADLSSLWLEAYAYEQDLPLIKQGMPAKVRLNHQVVHDFETQVMQVDAFLQGNARTARVRLQINNPEGKLQPGLFAQVSLLADIGNMLFVPLDAVLISGEKRIVFLDIGNGHLKPVEVRTGYSDGDHIVIRQGLNEGDKIVISGNFLLAAESKLKAGVEQW